MDAKLNVAVETSAQIQVTLVPFEKQTQKAISDLTEQVSWPKWVRQSCVNTIRSLKCFESVRDQLIDNTPLLDVARYIHKMGELKDLSVETVRQYVEHYKATIPPALIVKHMRPQLFKETIRKLDTEINTINDMNRLKTMMFQRLEMIFEREKAMGMPLPHVEKQYAIAMEIVMKLDEMVRQRVEPAIQTTDPNIDLDQLYNRKGLNEAVKDPVSRLRVMKFMEGVINYCGKNKPRIAET